MRSQACECPIPAAASPALPLPSSPPSRPFSRHASSQTRRKHSRLAVSKKGTWGGALGAESRKTPSAPHFSRKRPPALDEPLHVAVFLPQLHTPYPTEFYTRPNRLPTILASSNSSHLLPLPPPLVRPSTCLPLSPRTCNGSRTTKRRKQGGRRNASGDKEQRRFSNLSSVPD